MSRAQSIEVNCSNRDAELAHETRHRYPAFLWYQVETQEQGDLFRPEIAWQIAMDNPILSHTL